MAGRFLMTMKEYPPSQTPGSFNLEKIQKMPLPRPRSAHSRSKACESEKTQTLAGPRFSRPPVIHTPSARFVWRCSSNLPSDGASAARACWTGPTTGLVSLLISAGPLVPSSAGGSRFRPAQESPALRAPLAHRLPRDRVPHWHST